MRSDAIEPDAEEAWAAEIQRRLELIDSGKAQLIPWEEARRRIMGEDDSDAAH